MSLEHKFGETSCVDVGNITELKVMKVNADDLNEQCTTEVLLINDADDKQHPYKCKQEGCARSYSTKHELHLHEVICCNGKNFTCDTCKETFKNKCTLRRHMYLHQDLTDRKKYSCPYDSCPRYYYVKRSFDYHVKSHEREKLECTYPGCEKKLSSQTTLNKHMLVHRRKEQMCNKSVESAVPGFVCYICKRSFETKTDLERHISDHQDLPEKTLTYSNNGQHLNNERNGQENACPHNVYSCDICKKCSIIVSDVQNHVSLRQNEYLFCDLCKSELKTKEDLERHVLLHKEQELPCSAHGEVFRGKDSMNSHMLLHTGRKVTCIKRKESISVLQNIHTHMSLHKQEECLGITYNKLNTKKHVPFHQRQMFTCVKCKMSFTSKIRMQKHVCLQKEVSPHVMCNQRLTGVAEDHRHMTDRREPSKNKTLHCHVCKICFESELVMQKHISLHREPLAMERYACDVCKRVLKTKRGLKRHLSFHKDLSGRKMFICSYNNCSQSYVHRTNVLQPIKHAHEGEEFKGTFVDHRKKPLSKGTHNRTDPINFDMDVRERIYLMKMIMEEMFPTIQST